MNYLDEKKMSELESGSFFSPNEEALTMTDCTQCVADLGGMATCIAAINGFFGIVTGGLTALLFGGLIFFCYRGNQNCNACWHDIFGA